MAGTIGEPHAPQGLERPGPAIGRAAVEQGQLDIAQRGHARQQLEGLKHEADALAAHRRQSGLRQPGNILAVQKILSGAG